MYTIQSDLLLEMTAIQPHEELLAAGKLTIFDKELGRAAFVSHQWIGQGHPDPEFKQMKVLQDTLRNLFSGASEVSVDLITEAVYFRSKGITSEEWRGKRLYLWYDYFSCPQLEDKRHLSLQKAIDSIPAYVSRCDFFMALCPVLGSPDSSEAFSDYTWGDRGWCRVEQLVRDLTVNQGSWIVVKSAMHQELKVSQLAGSSPGEGRFTVDTDRARVAVVLRTILKKKLLLCLETGDFVHYRFLLNQQSTFLRNLPVEAVQDLIPPDEDIQDLLREKGPISAPTAAAILGNFLLQNGFKDAFTSDAAGWSPLCYASMKGDAAVISALLEVKCDPNEKTKKPRSEINMDKHSPVLSVSAKFKNHEAMRLLISARAEINSKAVHTPLGVACLANDAAGVRLLCQARADPHLKNPFGDHALNMAAAAGAIDAMEALFQQTKDFDLTFTLHTAVMLQGGSHQVVRRLIEAEADVDQVYRQPSLSLVGIVHKVKGLQFRFGRTTMMRRMAYHSRGATPLMLAILCGNFEAAAMLLVEGARTDIRNDRGKTAVDLASELLVPDYLLDALKGHMAKCSSIVTAASHSQFNKSSAGEDSVRSLEEEDSPAIALPKTL